MSRAVLPPGDSLEAVVENFPDDDEEGDDEEEEDEPRLKYERIGGDLAKVVRSDLVSAVCIGPKIMVT
jgi:vacuolar protein sorting-associated protein 41